MEELELEFSLLFGDESKYKINFDYHVDRGQSDESHLRILCIEELKKEDEKGNWDPFFEEQCKKALTLPVGKLDRCEGWRLESFNSGHAHWISASNDWVKIQFTDMNIWFTTFRSGQY